MVRPATTTTRVRHAGLALVGVAIGLVAYAWPLDAAASPPGPWLFVVAVAVGERIRLDNPRTRPSPVSLAVVAALALLHAGPGTVLAVAAGGWLAGAAVPALLGRGVPDVRELVARAVGAWALPGLVAASGRLVELLDATYLQVEGTDLLTITAVGAAIVLGIPLWSAVADVGERGGLVSSVYEGHLRASWAAGVAVAAGAGLAALVHPHLGGAALVLMLLPLLAARSGLHRLAQVRRTYDETVHAMSRLPEVIGAVPADHGARVARVAASMARDLGLSGSQVADLERAALLHEIGKVNASGDDREVALASAAVTRQVRNLQDVSDVIATFRDEQPLGPVLGQRRVPLASRILRTACEFDRLVADTSLDPGSWEAVRHFHLTAGHRHEPALIQALARSIDPGLLI